MEAKVYIENSKTQKIITLTLLVLEYKRDKIVRFDISNLTDDELEVLILAISEKKELSYTDIETFELPETPLEFGPDYNFYIKDNELVGYYNKELYPRKVK